MSNKNRVMTKRNKIRAGLFLLLFVLIYSYRFSPYKIEGLGFNDKVFPHKVNSVDRLNSALRYYEGVELDLVYVPEKNVLDVNHPPDNSISLNFETYLNAIGDDEYPFLWLDIKDLNLDNQIQVFDRLNALFNQRSYPKHKVLIETQHPESLPMFTKEGYVTSYYLKGGMRSLDENELKQEVDEISLILKGQPEIGISFTYEDYYILKEHFPERTKYTWAIMSPYDFLKFGKVKAIVEDETVAIMLSSYKTLKGNR